MQSRYKYTNLLIHESSPYLQQHAHNPVNWMPWGEAAFARAREEDKPLLVSIGYSTCHWCHVMEAEVFSDEEAAVVLNRTLIAVKVDREERPDIDQVYMAVCQMMTGNGGWPLNIFMTPEKKPFYAATYIPKHSSYGRTGIMELAEQIYEIWRTGRSNITRITDSITKALDESTGRKQAGQWDDTIPEAACSKLADEFDAVYGGFGTAPKFPQPQHLLFLLRYRQSKGNHRALQMVKETLLALRRGGIYDHVGGGFHRYATDRMWRVPHFEKMLYDQALLLLAYTEAWQATAEPVFRRTAEAVIDYVSREMTGPEGGFYTAEDADSAGEEGRFYLWTYEELAGILDKQQWECFTGYFAIAPEGNFTEATGSRKGLNILYLDPDSARDNRQAAENSCLDGILRHLFTVRQQRVHPFKDDKILTDWNGLMLAALATAARVFADPACLSLAVRNARFILEHLQTDEGDLRHSWRQGKTALSGYVTDYAFFAWGLIELYQAGFDTEILKHAIRITDRMITLFHDAEAGGFYITANNSETLLFRQKEYADNALPSGNSIALLVLLKLSRITGSTGYEEPARKLVESTADMLRTYPHAFSQLLCAGDFLSGNTCEIVVAATRDEAAPFLEALNALYFPGKVVVLKEPQDREIDELTTYTRFYNQPEGKSAVFVCRSFQCSRPVHTVDEMLQLLQTVSGDCPGLSDFTA